jgi:hypothetical protein
MRMADNGRGAQNELKPCYFAMFLTAGPETTYCLNK